jgi:hypothetical protein
MGAASRRPPNYLCNKRYFEETEAFFGIDIIAPSTTFQFLDNMGFSEFLPIC